MYVFSPVMLTLSDGAQVGCGHPALGEEPIEQAVFGNRSYQVAVDPARSPLGDLVQGVASSLAFLDQGPDHGAEPTFAQKPRGLGATPVAALT